MSSFCKCKSYSHFFSKNISLYAILINDQRFNDTLTNDIVSFEQMGSDLHPELYIDNNNTEKKIKR